MARTDDTVPLGLPETLCHDQRIRVAIDADWALLSARSIVAVDDAGIEYRRRTVSSMSCRTIYGS